MSFKLSSLAVAGALSVALATNANAITYSFSDTSNGENASGTYVDNGVNGVLTLTNNNAAPSSVADAISGIILTFATSPLTAVLTSQTSGNGDLITITPKKGQTSGSGSVFAGVPDNWTGGLSGAVLTLSTNHDDHNSGEICVGGAPCDLIVGVGSYANANASFGSHNPFIDGTGVFDLSGLTGLVLVSAQFQFGTGPTDGALITPTCTADCTQSGPPPSTTPLPAALPLFATGLGGMGILGWRRKKKSAARAA